MSINKISEFMENHRKIEREWRPILEPFWREINDELIRAGYSLKQMQEIGKIVGPANIKALSKVADTFSNK